MSYALYSEGKRLGSLATITGYGKVIEAMESYNSQRGGGGKTPALTDLVETGHSDNPRKVAEDISKLLTWGEHLPRTTVSTLKNLKQMLARAQGSVVVGES